LASLARLVHSLLGPQLIQKTCLQPFAVRIQPAAHNVTPLWAILLDAASRRRQVIANAFISPW